MATGFPRLDLANETPVAIIGAGPYGLSLSAHLSSKHVGHRIFGRPMEFWTRVAEAGDERYLKTYCFGTSLSSPSPGYSFGDYNGPRGLETHEPCSMANFSDYGRWFQQFNVPALEPVNVSRVAREESGGFSVTLENGERFAAGKVVVATGLAYFDKVPAVLTALPSELVTHTAKIRSFAAFRGLSVAVIGAGQSALEAAALLVEAGASPRLLVRKERILWHSQRPRSRSLWRRLRSPMSGLGYGPKAWALSSFPGVTHRMPNDWRDRFNSSYFPPEGAWWLRDRVENRLPIDVGAAVLEAAAMGSGVRLKLRDSRDGSERCLDVDHVIAGTGYDISVQRLEFLDSKLRQSIECVGNSPKLKANFESSEPGLHFVGPVSLASFGPLFRFVAGADYTARMVSNHMASKGSAARPVYAMKTSAGA
jgi:hypothetical protein